MFRGQSSASIDFLQFSCFLFVMSFSFYSIKGTLPLDPAKLEIMSKIQKQAIYWSKGQFYKILQSSNVKPQ